MTTVIYTPSLEPGLWKEETMTISDYEQRCRLFKRGFEKTPDDRPIKLYCDFDFKAKHAVSLDGFYDGCTEDIIELTKQHINKEIERMGHKTPPQYVFKPASQINNHIVSFHLICTNYKMTKVEQSVFWKNVERSIEADTESNWRKIMDAKSDKEFFDPQVYSRGRFMRSAYCTKDGEDRPFTIVDGTFEDTVLSIDNRNAETLTIPIPERIVNKTACVVSGAEAEEISAYLDAGMFKKLAQDYKTWTEMGFAIFGACGSKGLPLFLRFSALCSEKYDEYDCREWYERLEPRNDGRGMGSIKYLAKKENSVEYERISKQFKKIQTMNLHSPAFTTGLIADYFKLNYGSQFVCTNEVVYYFNGVYWKPDDKKYSHITSFVDKQIHSEIVAYCSEKTAFYNSKPDSENDITKIGELQKNCVKLRQNGFRKGVVADIVCAITNNAVEFDINPHLFAFRNAVYDLKAHGFIEPIPEQHISIVAQYEFDFKYSDIRVAELTKIIDTILPNENVRNYYLHALASGLVGNQNQEFYIATGGGGNGKSVLNSLMLETASDYGYMMPSECIQSDIKVGPNPEIANLHNKRFALTSEPPAGKKIRTATMKTLTGTPQINARGLYSQNTKTEIKATFVMECNTLPLVDELNTAVTRRIRAIKFCGEAVTKDEYDCKTDKTNFFVKNKFYESNEFRTMYKQALFMILCKMAFEDMPNIPEECAKITNEYMATSDDLYSWFSELYQKCPDGDAISIADLYHEYKDGEIYRNLCKVSKRRMTKAYFTEMVEKNTFLKRDVKCRDDYYNSKQIKSISVVGWVRSSMLPLYEQGCSEEK